MMYKSIFFLFFLYLSYFPLSKTFNSLNVQGHKSFGIPVVETAPTLNREYIFTGFNNSFHINHNKNNDFRVEFIRNLQADDQEKHSV